LAARAGFRIPRRSRADHAGLQWSMSSAIAWVIKQSEAIVTRTMTCGYFKAQQR
jgi:hypothetical protein